MSSRFTVKTFATEPMSFALRFRSQAAAGSFSAKAMDSRKPDSAFRCHFFQAPVGHLADPLGCRREVLKLIRSGRHNMMSSFLAGLKTTGLFSTSVETRITVRLRGEPSTPLREVLPSIIFHGLLPGFASSPERSVQPLDRAAKLERLFVRVACCSIGKGCRSLQRRFRPAGRKARS